jgi:flagellar biosynthesis/type III secretory pathway protein FliH
MFSPASSPGSVSASEMNQELVAIWSIYHFMCRASQNESEFFLLGSDKCFDIRRQLANLILRKEVIPHGEETQESGKEDRKEGRKEGREEDREEGRQEEGQEEGQEKGQEVSRSERAIVC